jgi:hypothetical protein
MKAGSGAEKTEIVTIHGFVSKLNAKMESSFLCQ